MKLLYPCRTKDDVRRIAGLFNGTLLRTRETEEYLEIEKRWEDIDIYIYLHNDCTICGLRGDAIVISNEFETEEVRQDIMTRLCASEAKIKAHYAKLRKPLNVG